MNSRNIGVKHSLDSIWSESVFVVVISVIGVMCCLNEVYGILIDLGEYKRFQFCSSGCRK